MARDQKKSETTMPGGELCEPWPRQEAPVAVSKRGYDLLRDPLLNKDAGFPAAERAAFGLDGLVPAAALSLEAQAQREYSVLAAISSPTDQYLHLANLMNQNEHLFHRVIADHLSAMMPVVYTPTVAWAVRNLGRAFQTQRGIWLSPEHRGRMAAVLRQAVAEREIKLLVVTDNESILGIGDQGAGGLAIAIGKLALYTAGAGIPPAVTLPVSLDVGTNNPTLLADESYAGWRHNRLRGDEYADFIDEFVAAVDAVFPGAVIQWEDFRKDSAASILLRHRGTVPSFNDDIQGTGAVALAGVLSAARISGVPLTEHRIAVYGAGAAGLGIVRQLRNALRLAGCAGAEVTARVAALDSRGLIVDDGSITDAYKRELAWPVPLAQQHALEDPSQRDLHTLVTRYRPTVLIGTSGQAGAFTETLVQQMCEHAERPVILPFSNPTEYAEGVPEDLLRWSRGRALVATGSPFAPVEHAGKQFVIGQGNNVFIFPGLGLAALLGGFREITDDHVSVAADALAQSVSAEELADGQLFPPVTRLREISRDVAVAVIASERGLHAEAPALRAQVERRMWRPIYSDYSPA